MLPEALPPCCWMEADDGESLQLVAHAVVEGLHLQSGGAQPLDDETVGGVVEVVEHGHGGHFAHILDGCEVGHGGGHEGVDVAEMERQLAGAHLADIAYAQGE